MTTYASGDVLTAANANSFATALVVSQVLSTNQAINNGVTYSISTTFEADPNRFYVAVAGVTTYGASPNLYLDNYLSLGGTTVARGYIGITATNPRSTIYLEGKALDSLSGTTTVQLEMTPAGGTAYVNGSSSYNFTHLRVYDVGVGT